MTLVDSIDSVLMLYSYAGFPERSFKMFESRRDLESEANPTGNAGEGKRELDPEDEARMDTNMRVKMNAISGLSIALTLMSILVAFRYRSPCSVFPNYQG